MKEATVTPSDTKSWCIVMLASDGATTRIVYHELSRHFDNVHVVIEEAVTKKQLLTRRLRKLGVVQVAGQLLFMLLIVPGLRRAGASRIAEIKAQNKFDDSPIPNPIHVSSVNSEEARRTLEELMPRVVVVQGTRIIGRETLQSVTAPFVNTHAGITPLYRGAHGGYWALAEGRADLAGTTVHLVDEGIDTGSIIGQAIFSVEKSDSFVTYPYLHAVVGLPFLIAAVRDALSGTLQLSAAPALPSKLRSHPTLLSYLWCRLRRGVK